MFMKKIIVMIFAACLIISDIPRLALAEPAYTIVGDDNGLEIHVPEKTQDKENLEPGDKESSSLMLRNTGSNFLHVYLRTNIVEEKAPNGGYLKDVMTLVIKDGDKVITAGTFRGAAEKGNIYLGIMEPGEEKNLYFLTELPTDAGNEYQAASMKVNWTFTTQTDSDGDDDDNGDEDDDGDRDGRDRDGGGDFDEEEGDDGGEIEVEDEDIPQGPGETPSEPGIEITVEDEEVPVGPAVMPKTGEISPLFFYGTGALMLVLGITLRKK